jgi:hypothetical protein
MLTDALRLAMRIRLTLLFEITDNGLRFHPLLEERAG